MAELAIKKRVRVAAERAAQLLHDDGFDAFIIPGNPFHVVAVKKRRVRFIRIVLGEIESEDRRLVERFAPDSKTVSREFWLRKRGDQDFKRILVPSK